MLDKNAIADFLNRQIKDTDLFPVEVSVTPDNRVVIEIDGPRGVDIDTCVTLTRAFEQEFPREQEDYELEIGGAGLTAPFKVIGQYRKNIGKRIELLTADGRKLKATLLDADEQQIKISYPVKRKVEGKKKPEITDTEETLPMSDVKKASLLLEF